MIQKLILHVFLALLFTSCLKENVDLIVKNAKIYTVDNGFTIASAMAIGKDTIVAIGPEHEILNKYTATQILDAEKMFVYPGFIDAHCHFYGYGLSLQTVNLVGSSSFDEVVTLTMEHRHKAYQGWITGRGWDQNDWKVKTFPEKSILDRLFPETAVFLKRIDGHAAIANQKALDLAGITTETTVEGGKVEVKNGQLTGLLIDRAVDLVNEVVPVPDQPQKQQALRQAEANCVKAGLTTVDDAGLEKEIIDLIAKMQEAGELKIKVYAMANPSEENLEHFLKNGPVFSDRLTVNAFKIYADGALGSRGAMLLEPYHDVENEHQGWLLQQPSYFKKMAKEIYDGGFQLNVHAIGDSANRLILSTYAEVLQGVNDRRWRIEHAQIIHEDDFELFARNTIIPSIQPTHATSDMYWAAERIGNERIVNAYAYQKLLKQNGILALGTDFPVEDIAPINTFYAAVTRKDKKGYPADGFQSTQLLSREEALKGMTIWAAISNFEETQKGSLEVGKKADFVLLDRDLMTAEKSELLKTNVLVTAINGEIVYQLNGKINN